MGDVIDLGMHRRPSAKPKATVIARRPVIQARPVIATAPMPRPSLDGVAERLEVALEDIPFEADGSPVVERLQPVRPEPVATMRGRMAAAVRMLRYGRI